MERCILHCDMNNFYASVECFLNPKLNTRPIAVCGETEDRHGIVLAKNYKAKGYGVKPGQLIILTAGYPTGEGSANMMKIIEVK